MCSSTRWASMPQDGLRALQPTSRWGSGGRIRWSAELAPRPSSGHGLHRSGRSRIGLRPSEPGAHLIDVCTQRARVDGRCVRLSRRAKGHFFRTQWDFFRSLLPSSAIYTGRRSLCFFTKLPSRLGPPAAHVGERCTQTLFPYARNSRARDLFSPKFLEGGFWSLGRLP